MRRISLLCCVLALAGGLVSEVPAQVIGGIGTPQVTPGSIVIAPRNKIYDYWTTGDRGTHVNLNIPGGFFGLGSDPLDVVIDVVGEPFGRGAGQGLSANADTSIRRQRNPSFSGIGDSDTVPIRMHGLSLKSITPITVTYNGGQNPQFWEVHVGLSDLVPQPWGSLTATKTFSGGGLFDSNLTVVPKFSFVHIANGTISILDVGNPTWNIPPSTITAASTPWITSVPGQSGNFHPGYSPGPTPEQINYIEFSNNCAEHEAEPCEDCPDEGGPEVEIREVFELEATGILN